MIHLSAPFLTRPQIPAFTGSIEVDITAEDLPSGDRRENAEFGKCYPFVCIYYNYVCSLCIVLLSIIIDKFEIQNGNKLCT